jgi:hypothetical protein
MTAKRPAWAGASWYDQVQMTPAEHLRVAAQLRRLKGNSKAEELALHHEQRAQVMRTNLNEQVPPIAPK